MASDILIMPLKTSFSIFVLSQPGDKENQNAGCVCFFPPRKHLNTRSEFFRIDLAAFLFLRQAPTRQSAGLLAVLLTDSPGGHINKRVDFTVLVNPMTEPCSYSSTFKHRTYPQQLPSLGGAGHCEL